MFNRLRSFEISSKIFDMAAFSLLAELKAFTCRRSKSIQESIC